MMPFCQNCWGNDPNIAVFLGQHEVPALCEEHLQELEGRILSYREKHQIENA